MNLSKAFGSLASLLLFWCMAGWSSASAAESFVGFINANDVAPAEIGHLGGVRGRVLSADPQSGRMALIAELPAGWSWDGASATGQSLEIFVLAGKLEAEGTQLEPKGYLYVAPTASTPALAARAGARLLVFAGPTGEPSGFTDWFMVEFDESRWRPGLVGPSAGVDLPVEIFDLRRDPVTGARTWLAAIQPGFEFPWERHSMVEEGFLVEGVYDLNECLPDGVKSGRYTADGYFYRPANILHGGPDSTARSPSIWLFRSPADLDVEFSDVCNPAP